MLTNQREQKLQSFWVVRSANESLSKSKSTKAAVRRQLITEYYTIYPIFSSASSIFPPKAKLNKERS
eukprot:56568-Amphidinium_carterae.1